ncbi:MAG: AI-2E family transporter [Actinobacteria bacterium]|nr:AI-2E family transporter [Actinomycetota bacterium]
MVAGLVLFAVATWSILEPLIVAAVLATAFWPWVTRISRASLIRPKWRLPRLAATALIYITALSVAAGLTWLILASILPQAEKLSQAFPQQTQSLSQFLDPFRSGNILSGAAKVAGEVAKATSGQNGTGQPGTTNPANQVPVNIGVVAISLFGGLVNVVLVLVFTFFLVVEGDRFAQALLVLLPKERRPGIRSLGLAIRDQISRWVLAQATYALVSGGIMTTGMFALQIPDPWVYGAFSTLLALFPGVGPGFSAVPALFVAMGLSTWQTVGVALFGMAVYALDGTVLVPKIFGDVLRLPMFAVLLATLIGALLMGIWGALIASQAAVIVQMIIRDVLGRDPVPGSSQKP